MINQQNNFNVLQEKMSYMATRLSNIAREQSTLSWLTVLPRLHKCSLVSQKQNFELQYLWGIDHRWKDSLVIVDALNHTLYNTRYHAGRVDLGIQDMWDKPFKSELNKFCERQLLKNLLIPLWNTLTHNELRDNIVEMLEVTYDVKVKTIPIPLNGQTHSNNLPTNCLSVFDHLWNWRLKS